MQITRLYTLTLLSVALFIRRTFSEAIAEGPFNTAADVGSWANFSCSVSCDHLINWFVEGYPSDISSSCSSTHNDLMVCKQTTHICGSSSTGNYTEVLRVLAKSEHAGSKIAVQCAAVSRSFESRNACNPFITYSRYALLTVNSASEQPTPSPCSTQGTVTVTDVSTVTETRAESTVTVTSTFVSTSTVVVTSTPPPLPAPNSVTDSKRQFGTMMTQLFMWAFTIAMGLMFARLAVHL